MSASKTDHPHPSPALLEKLSVREKIVIANWKMNGSAEANRLWAEEFLAKLGDLNCRTAVCAPFVYLSELVRLFKDTGVAVGAQTVSPRDQGAFTGEVSAAMLADIGMSLCLVGHSERRTLWGEDDESVAVQAENLVAHGIAPVVCVGETLAEREAGLTEAVVLRQLQTVLTRVPVAKLGAVAYEPVWAIGTGKTATAEQAQEIHAYIRQVLTAKFGAAAQETAILYGGSCKPSNAAEIFAKEDVDGGLIGGAALKAEDFLAIGKGFSK